MKAKLATLLVAAMLVLAGCTGGTGSPTPSGTESAQTAQVNFYISDNPGDIDDFSHLNVTVTQVAFIQAEDDDGNETEAEMEDEEDDEDETEMDDENETEMDDDADAEETEMDDDADAEETEMDAEGDRIVRDVNDTTVDLTQLQGTNASLVDSFNLSSGSYTKAVLYVDGINATLTDGTSQRVKLPSGRLQLNQPFTIGANESVDFVFDFTVVKAGNSGKYVLQPVVSESGLDQEIDRVDLDEDDEDEREDDAEASLDVAFENEVAAGENATLAVDADGEAAANVTVVVEQYGPDGETLSEETYTTDADGQVTVDVATNATELEVEAETEADAEGELELEL